MWIVHCLATVSEDCCCYSNTIISQVNSNLERVDGGWSEPGRHRYDSLQLRNGEKGTVLDSSNM